MFLSPLLLLPPPTFNGYLSLPNGTFTPAFGCCALLCVPLVALHCLALACAAGHYMNRTAWVAPSRLHSMRCTAYIAPRGLQEIGVRGPRWLTFVHAISRKQPIRTTKLALPEGRGCKELARNQSITLDFAIQRPRVPGWARSAAFREHGNNKRETRKHFFQLVVVDA